MHYPLAMPLLAPTDQRARKELEEPVATAAKQNEARGRGRRGLQMETEGRGRGGLWGSWLCERRQLDPPERRQRRAKDELGDKCME